MRGTETGLTDGQKEAVRTKAGQTTHGKIYHDEQLHLKVPSYKEEYVDGYGGWHIERGGPPKPTGAMWLRFSARKTKKDGVDICDPILEALRAK